MAFKASSLILTGTHPSRHRICEVMKSATTLALSCGSALSDDALQCFEAGQTDLQTRLKDAMRQVDLLQMRQQGLLEQWQNMRDEIRDPDVKGFFGDRSAFNDPPPTEWGKQFVCTWVLWRAMRRYESLYNPWLQWCSARGLTTWLDITDGIIAQYIQDLIFEAKSSMHTETYPAALSECAVQCLVDTFHVSHIVGACIWGTSGSVLTEYVHSNPFCTSQTAPQDGALYVPRWSVTPMGLVLQDPSVPDVLRQWCTQPNGKPPPQSALIFAPDNGLLHETLSSASQCAPTYIHHIAHGMHAHSLFKGSYKRLYGKLAVGLWLITAPRITLDSRGFVTGLGGWLKRHHGTLLWNMDFFHTCEQGTASHRYFMNCHQQEASDRRQVLFPKWDHKKKQMVVPTHWNLVADSQDRMNRLMYWSQDEIPRRICQMRRCEASLRDVGTWIYVLWAPGSRKVYVG